MNALEKKYKKAFIRQLDHADCGVACLSTLTRFYGGYIPHERIREWSGTDADGTTLLGLYQGAEKIGFKTEAFEGNIEELKKLRTPCILHVVMDDHRQHYIICYGYHNGQFIISDPADSVLWMKPEDLESIWSSKALLTVIPGSNFESSTEREQKKKFWFWHLIQEDVNILTTSLIIGGIISILSLSVAVFSQKLIDDILPEKSLLKLKIGIALLVFLLLFNALIGFIRKLFLLRQSRDFNNRIIRYFFDALIQLPKSFFDTRKSGDIIARLNDTSRIQKSINYLATNFLIDILMILTSSIFIFFYSPALGGLTLVAIPVIFFTTYIFHRPIVIANRSVMESYAQSESNFVDVLFGMDTIKVENNQKFYADKTFKYFSDLQDKNYDLGRVGIRFGLSTEIITVAIMIGIIAMSSFMVLEESIKLGAMMAIIQMISILLPSVSRISLTNIQLQEARVALDRMFEFTFLKSEREELENPKSEITHFKELQIEELTFRYPGKKRVLDEIHLNLKKGEIISILGESGCGKTTTLHLLQKLYPPENGKILINGIHLNQVTHQSWRSIIGVVPQEIKIFNDTILNNIIMGGHQPKIQQLSEFLENSKFGSFIQSFPQGLLTLVGENGINLSEGQKQIIAMIRALYKRPQLLLLDEPTASLDRKSSQFVLQLLEQKRKEMGIIIITHNILVARQTDRIYIMEKGKINTMGDHPELMKTPNFYSDFWNNLKVE